MLRITLLAVATFISFGGFGLESASAATSCPGGGTLVCKPKCTLGPPPVCTNTDDCTCQLTNTGGKSNTLGRFGTTTRGQANFSTIGR